MTINDICKRWKSGIFYLDRTSLDLKCHSHKKAYKFVFIYLPSGLLWRSNRNDAYDSGCLVVDLTIINQGRATISKECVNYELWGMLPYTIKDKLFAELDIYQVLQNYRSVIKKLIGKKNAFVYISMHYSPLFFDGLRLNIKKYQFLNFLKRVNCTWFLRK